MATSAADASARGAEAYTAPDLVPGLYNNGNTCFAISVLQALAPLSPLHHYLADVARGNLAIEKIRRDREAKEHAAQAEDEDLMLYLIEDDEEEDQGRREERSGTSSISAIASAEGDGDDDPKKALLDILERRKEELRRRASGIPRVKKGWRSGSGRDATNEETGYTLAVRLLQTLSRLNLPLSTSATDSLSSSDNPAIDLASVSPVFSDGNQHDAHEFLLHLLALVEDDAHLQAGWRDLQTTKYEKAALELSASSSVSSFAAIAAASPIALSGPGFSTTSLFASARLRSSRHKMAEARPAPLFASKPLTEQKEDKSAFSQLRGLPCRGLTHQRILCRSCFGYGSGGDNSSGKTPAGSLLGGLASGRSAFLPVSSASPSSAGPVLNKPSWVQEAFSCLSLTLPQHSPFGLITLKGLLAQYFAGDEISGYRCPNENCPAKLKAQQQHQQHQSALMGGAGGKSDRASRSLKALADLTSSSKSSSTYAASGYQGGPAVKQTAISKLPEVLFLHIKRQGYFDFEQAGMMMGAANVKSSSRFSFDLCLDMSRFLTNAVTNASAAASSFSSSADGTEVSNGDSSNLFDLLSVVEHLGGGRGGHYVTYRRVPAAFCDPSTAMPQWVVCSDSTVRPVDVSRVLGCEAYLLCYVKRHSAEAAAASSTAKGAGAGAAGVSLAHAHAAWLQRAVSSTLCLDYRSSLILGLSGDPDRDLDQSGSWLASKGVAPTDPRELARDLMKQAAAAAATESKSVPASSVLKLSISPAQAAQLALVARPPSVLVAALVAAAVEEAAKTGVEGAAEAIVGGAQARGWLPKGGGQKSASLEARTATDASFVVLAERWLGLVEAICSHGVLFTDSAHSMGLRPVWFPRE